MQMNRYKWDAVGSVVAYAIALGLSWVSARSSAHASGDSLAGLAYVVPGSMAIVGVASVVASAATLLTRTLRAAWVGQAASAVPHLIPVLLYGYLGVLLVGASGLTEETVTTVALLAALVVHLEWIVYAVRETRRGADASAGLTAA